MGHSQSQRSNQQQRRNRGNQPQRGYPREFNQGEIVEGLVFETFDRPGGGTFVAAPLSDGTFVEPDSWECYRFVPRLDGTPYNCSVKTIGASRKQMGLPCVPGELSADEWKYEPPQKTAAVTATLAFAMSEGRGGKPPRPMATYEGRTVFVERGLESQVPLGSPTRVVLTESKGGGALFARPVAALRPPERQQPRRRERGDGRADGANQRQQSGQEPARTRVRPVVDQDDRANMPPAPEQPSNPYKIVIQRFTRKAGCAPDCYKNLRIREETKGVYAFLSNAQFGTNVSPSCSVERVRAAAETIRRGIRCSVSPEKPFEFRANATAYLAALDEAERRAIVLREHANAIVANDGMEPLDVEMMEVDLDSAEDLPAVISGRPPAGEQEPIEPAPTPAIAALTAAEQYSVAEIAAASEHNVTVPTLRKAMALANVATAEAFMGLPVRTAKFRIHQAKAAR